MTDTSPVIYFGWNISLDDLNAVARGMGLNPLGSMEPAQDFAKDMASEIGCRAIVQGNLPDITLCFAKRAPMSGNAALDLAEQQAHLGMTLTAYGARNCLDVVGYDHMEIE